MTGARIGTLDFGRCGLAVTMAPRQRLRAPFVIRHSSFVTRLLLLLLAGIVVSSVGAAGVSGTEWPQFLGPNRDGSTAETNLASSWPNDGPRAAWQKKIGAGFAGPVVSGGKVIVFHRVGDKETVDCLDAADGRELWQAEYPTEYRDDFGFDPGPRGTPAIADGRVYTFGAEGALHCWNLADGKKLWGISTKTEFRQRKGFFGMACSPLVEGSAVILNLGGQNGAGLVAFDRKEGRVLWKATDDNASYASPVMGTVSGKRRVFAITREALVSVDPANGSVLFRYPWRPSMEASVSAASPLVIGDQVFISASYGLGGTLLKLGTGAPQAVWSTDDALSNHYATSVHHDGFLYGFHGRQEHGCELRCVELLTGKVRWSEAGLGAGTVTLAGTQLLILTENGELMLAPATPAGFKTMARAQVLPSSARAHPALAGGRLYARSKDRLICVALTGKTPKSEP